MKKTRNDLEKYLHRSKMQDIIDDVMLNENTEDCFVVYLDVEGDLRITGTAKVLEAMGMVVLAMDVLKNIAWEEND